MTPAQRRRPGSTDDVVAAVRAARDLGLRVKAVGAGHSFTGIAVAPGIQLDMSGLSGVRAVDGTRVTLGAGTVLHDLPAMLDPLGLALQNMGDIDAQTISGATSTGTHGTGAAFGGLATRIVGATLVTGRAEVRNSEFDRERRAATRCRAGPGCARHPRGCDGRLRPEFRAQCGGATRAARRGAGQLGTARRRIRSLRVLLVPAHRAALTKTNTRLAADARTHPLSPAKRWFETA